MKNFQWKNSVITHMHIELTNYCNAACPFCPRFVDSTARLRPELILKSISIDEFKEWFPASFMKNIQRILFCGTHGDPLMAKDFLQIIDYVHATTNNCSILIHTNGGLRSADFFKTLGEKLVKNKSHHRLTFSIDGLEDTNHLYRRNVNWNKLIENVKAYNFTGAYSEWEFLVFKHNEHQQKEAEQLSKKLGFNQILFKKALGFDPGKSGKLQARGVYDKNGILEYTIEPPNDKGMVNSSHDIQDINANVKKNKNMSYLKDFKPGVNTIVEDKIINFDEKNIPSWNAYLHEFENYQINCKSCIRENSAEIYVNSNGIVFPCCFVGTRVDSAIDLYEDTQLRVHIRKFNQDNFNLKKISINEIIKNGFLDRVYTDSWDKEKFSNGKLAYCAMTCGDKSEIDRIYEKYGDRPR